MKVTIECSCCGRSKEIDSKYHTEISNFVDGYVNGWCEECKVLLRAKRHRLEGELEAKMLVFRDSLKIGTLKL